MPVQIINPLIIYNIHFLQLIYPFPIFSLTFHHLWRPPQHASSTINFFIPTKWLLNDDDAIAKYGKVYSFVKSVSGFCIFLASSSLSSMALHECVSSNCPFYCVYVVLRSNWMKKNKELYLYTLYKKYEDKGIYNKIIIIMERNRKNYIIKVIIFSQTCVCI